MKLSGLLDWRRKPDADGARTRGGKVARAESGKRAGAQRPSLLARLSFRGQMRFLGPVLVAFLMLAFVFMWLDYRRTVVYADLNEILGDALTHSQRLAKAAPAAMAGNPEAFGQLRESRQSMSTSVVSLRNAQNSAISRFVAVPEQLSTETASLEQQWSRSDVAAGVLIQQQALLGSLGAMRKSINESNAGMLEAAQKVARQRLIGRPNVREISAAGDLVMLTQKIAKDVNQLVLGDDVDPVIMRTLAADVDFIRELVDGLTSGSERLGLTGAVDSESRRALSDIKALLDKIGQPLATIVRDIAKIRAARVAEREIYRGSESLRERLLVMRGALRATHESRGWTLWLFALFAALSGLAGLALIRGYLVDTRIRTAEAERQQKEAERLEQEAKRINDQNQAAILRLMNELQDVADGDLTVQPTVTEDITGAIADSVSYTLEELRGIVTRINSTAELVNSASSKAQQISARLQIASEQQSKEIRATGEAVLRMARQINDVSTRAAESANVARRSLSASEGGAAAVENAIAGMNGIRDQIQETAKRIKRLGESSQEIGEIVELISDITEQTNVLALNAAIQAASAGEAGRGFTVVAEEVQRLAERSGEATRQIAALIKAIQTDTHDAIAAMERSTQGVVEGTRLSDEAGKALGEIGRVSRELAELIEGFSATTSEQASSASGVAQAIQRILIVTEQTSKGTLLTASSIKQLAALAQELKSSVARFKVA